MALEMLCSGASIFRVVAYWRSGNAVGLRGIDTYLLENSFLVEMQERADKIALWLEIMWEPYEELVSRREETASRSGFDDRPRVRQCEHRIVWQRGWLCLACDNTGWRPCAKGEPGIDPYAREVVGKGVTVVSDESPSHKRAIELQRIDRMIDALRRDLRIRKGAEGAEGKELRNVRLVERKPRTVRKILRGLEALRTLRPWLYAQLEESIAEEIRGDALLELATMMYFVAPGGIDAPEA